MEQYCPPSHTPQNYGMGSEKTNIVPFILCKILKAVECLAVRII
jgi:hypothetical protein